MANEITSKISLILNTTNGIVERFEPPSAQYTQTNAEVFANTVSLTTVDAKLSFTNSTNFGWGFFQNVSSSTAAIVNVGVDSTAVIRSFTTLTYGKWAVLPLVPTSTYRAQMSTTSGGILKYGVWGS
jgi:hypothetical protein